MTAVRWSKLAQLDIAAIDANYHASNPGYAARVAQLAVKAGRFLADNHEAGPAIDRRTRKWRVAGTPYLLFYRNDGRVLRIVRITHAARDWEQLIR